MLYFDKCVYEHILVCERNVSLRSVSFTHPKLVFDRKKWGGGGGLYFYVYLSIIRNTENSK